MIYFLVHLGSPFPSYIEFCIQQIYKKDNNCDIILCGDFDPLIKGKKYSFINSKELNIPAEINYFHHDPNPLWQNSLKRIFAINSFMQKENIEGIIHFDNDVMVYEDFNKIQNAFKRKNYITPHKHTEFTFGFSFLNNKDEFNILTERIQSTIQIGEQGVRRLTGDEAHEMRLLNFCGSDLIESLPTHPEIGCINNFVFDPSSYGQYAGGTPNGHPPGFVDRTQLVGSYFETKPQIVYNKERDIFNYMYKDKSYNIFNLHIHSKKLNEFYHEA